jgi:riboflavin kinase/FMN adenylyltransferase
VELIRGIHNIKTSHKGCVLTIGKFDGVHLGHNAVLSRLTAKAATLDLPAMVMVFEPLPEEVFCPEKAPARLSRLRDKYLDISKLGVDRMLCVRFNHDFAQLSAQNFIQELLVNKLGVRYLVVGDDFRFGQDRIGDFQLLQEASESYQFELSNTDSFCLEHKRISSTAVRQALQQGQFDQAEAMLGRPFVIRGKVIHGDKQGRTIGFPTANILLKRHKAPLNGVFAVKVNINQRDVFGVANIGSRPTVKGVRAQLEVHLFNFAADLYGQYIEVQIKAKLRDEIRFDSFAQLAEQIKQDAQQAKALFAAQPH